MKLTCFLSSILFGAGVLFEANASLYDRGNGLIYDDELDITWMQGPRANLMDWHTALAWAENLTYAGYSDWRLPTAMNIDGTGPCSALFECSEDELGHLFYHSLNNESAPGSIHDLNFGPFEDVALYFYWTATEKDDDNAWFFYFLRGSQYYHAKDNKILAWAVRDGDSTEQNSVGMATTPIPAAYLLFAFPSILLMVYGRRNRKQLSGQ